MQELNYIPQYELKKTKSGFPEKRITGSREAYEFIRSFYGDDILVYESFYILLLNTSNTTTAFCKVSQGGTKSTICDVKMIAKYALDGLANGVILAHNHPSGNLIPSDADKKITTQIKQGLQLLDIKVLDHIILGEESYYSMADSGEL